MAASTNSFQRLIKAPLHLHHLPLLLLLLPLLLLLHTCPAQATSSRTLSEQGSYIRFPNPWLPAPQRILRLTFRTSELNGLLLYSKDRNGTEFLLVRLLNGTVEARLNLSLADTVLLGEFENDNAPHTLTVYHDPSRFLVQYALDSSPAITRLYPAGQTLNFGGEGVFVGGAPSSNVTDGLEPSFVGCLQDVMLVSSNVSSIEQLLQGVEDPPEEEQVEVVGVVLDGCVTDPCVGVDCGLGVCRFRWPNTTFCDCRGTGMLGSTCSEDPSNHELTFEAGHDPTHYCYRPLPQPYVPGSSNSASLQLTPPIPLEGTLLIAHTEDSRNHFSLRIEGGRIIFDIVDTHPEVNMSLTLTLNAELNRSSTRYQVDLNVERNRAEVVLYSIEEEGEAQQQQQQQQQQQTTTTERLREIERRDTTGMAAVTDLFPRAAIFSAVCLGGSLLEHLNYAGTIRSAFYDRYSLLELRNFCELAAVGVDRSNVVVFADTDDSRALEFRRFSLATHRIAFQARIRQGLTESQGGAIFSIESGRGYELILTPIGTDQLLPLLRGPMVGDFVLFREGEDACRDTPTAYDGEWHSYEIFPTVLPGNGADAALSIMVNGVNCSTQASALVRDAIEALGNASLRFGPTNPRVFGSNNQLAIFSGCISNVEFQETAESAVFRPNLEAAPRTNALFSVQDCFHCDADSPKPPPDFRSCDGGRVCRDLGAGLPLVCACPEGFSDSGGTCEDSLLNSTCTIDVTPTTTTPLTTTPTTPTTTTPSSTGTDNTTTPPTSPSSTTTTTTKVSVPLLNNGAWAGLGVAIAVIIVVVLAVAIGACVLYRRGARIRGFYRTNESTGSEASMTRYSASLKQLSSEVVDISKEPSEPSWPHKNGNYANGGGSVLLTTSSGSVVKVPSTNRTSVINRDKEFYL